ncbi:alpha/beta hydrolase [Mariniflexile gromovii]|uniref:Alpha/beta hydrolase n=2 Tax=Mariniflexile gromovii TaxID=362523 RepID=A0ABS4BWC1_9FLAO|nr:alpha/beta hydrolase [Mariniflexile gromovii]MBP0904301.1 alpha/beta hydrolase [Mariniflexile gromovii]
MKTKTTEINGMKIAYREFGKGDPIVFCNRFRGTLDTWDPLFIDEMSKKFKVVIFDYPQVGYSEGTFPNDVTGLSEVVVGLCKNLGFKNVALAGWSFGGFVAQTVALKNPGVVSKLILIGTNPPGENKIPLEPIFLEKALIPINSLEDEQVLFFEPDSEFSLAASKASHDRIYAKIDVSKIPSTQEEFNRYFVAGNEFKNDNRLRDMFFDTDIPIFILHGDHDVSFAVENWFAILRKLKFGQLIIYTKAGHAPQHQLPELTAKYISDFITLN